MEDKIINIFCEISGCKKESINKETLIRETGVNSLLIVQILVTIEQEFGIEIDDEDFNFSNIRTLEDLFNVVKKQL